MGFIKKIFWLLLVSSCTPSDGDSLKSTTEGAIEYISMSTTNAVDLSREATVKISSFSRDGRPVSGSGAYVKYRKHYFVLTAAHVVEGGPSALVISKSEKVVADVVYLDEASDIAVLKLHGLFTRNPLAWRPVEVNVGAELTYTGFPNGQNNLTMQGTVSGFSGNRIVMHSYAWSGSSGSVVINRRGQLVGIVSAIEIGYAFGMIPQLIEDMVLVSPIKSLNEEVLLASLSS